MADLARFLDEALRRPPTRNPCLLFAADWCVAETGRDPAEGFRNLDERASLRLLVRTGGLLPFSVERMSAAGFEPTEEPLSGDVGVVEAMTERGPAPAAAICTGRLWAGLTTTGLVFQAYPILAAWRVACRTS